MGGAAGGAGSRGVPEKPGCGSPRGRPPGPHPQPTGQVPAGRPLSGRPALGAPTPQGRPPPLCAARGTQSSVLVADGAVASLAVFWLNNEKREREVGGWAASPPRPAVRQRTRAGGRRRRGAGPETRAPREGKSFRPFSKRLRSFGRAGRCQSQANTAPAWARRDAAAGGRFGVRRGSAGETEARRGPGGLCKATKKRCSKIRPPPGPVGSPGNISTGGGEWGRSESPESGDGGDRSSQGSESHYTPQ